MLRAEVVIVIGGYEDALGVTVVEDGDRLCRGEVCGVRIFLGARINILRITEPRTDQVEVVDTVVEDL